MAHLSTSRVLKAVNVVIVVVLLAAAGAIWWYAWRPLPQRSGSIPAPVSAGVTVAFDKLGEPHIRAQSIHDALTIQGYVTAQDRLWQMDSLRRYSSGQLAEVLGPVALETDRDMRRLRLRRLAENAYVKLSPADRASLAAYTLGVNQFISTHLDNLPVEFTLLGYQPRPWSAVDTLLIGLYMFRDLTTTWRDEISKAAMLSGGDAEKVNFLFAPRSGEAPSPGSNGWAVAGSHTASGKPLLSNDMHLAFSMPGIWYMTHLQAPGLDVAGVTVPGLMGIVVGHNQHIAWGITNLQFDVQDLYIEHIDERTGRYLYQGHLEQAHEEREIIQVKGQRSVEASTWVTRHGPIFLVEGNARMALRWTAAEPGLTQVPLLDIDRAENWQQFTTALSRWVGPGANFIYADRDGNIGYHAAGVLPKRRGYSGDVPVDGSTGDADWDGFIPFDQLPSFYNPASGIIASANQNPFPANYPYPVNGNFAAPPRIDRIRQLLTAHNGWKAGDMLAVQGDIVSLFNKFLAQQTVQAVDRRNAHNVALDPAVALLRSWDGRMDKDQGAPFLISLVYQHVRSAVAEAASPGKGQVYEFAMGPAAIEQLLRDRPAGWFDDYDTMLLRAFMDAVDEGKRIAGRDVSRWRYGNYWRVEIDNPIVHPALERIPVIGKMLDFFEIGPLPMSGSSTTPKQTTRTLGPSMRMTADLADWNNSTLNIVTGESGQPFSSHYKDQWDAYYNLRSYPMQYGSVTAKQTLEFRPSGN